MDFDLFEKAQKNIIIVAHRGACGGNIPCNTMASYETALKQGADMIEVDVSCSKDGKLFLFHPGMEKPHLNKFRNLKMMKFSSIQKLRYVNTDNTETQFGITSFDDFLEQFKGRCFINIDKFWSNPEKIYNYIKRHAMTDQILVKSKPDKNVFTVLEELCPELAFMPIVSDKHKCHKELMSKNINYVGAEVLFKKESAQVASDKFIEMMHKDGKLVWVNSIIYDYKEQLAAGHSDDTALTESEEIGWGWLADKNFDFIQTDWAMMLIEYLKRTDRYYKS